MAVGHELRICVWISDVSGWCAGKDLKRLQRQVSSRKLQKFWQSFRTTRSTTAQLAQAFLDTGIPTAQVSRTTWCSLPTCYHLQWSKLALAFFSCWQDADTLH